MDPDPPQPEVEKARSRFLQPLLGWRPPRRAENFKRRGRLTLAVLFVPVLLWAAVHFRWPSVTGWCGRMLYGAHDSLWLPLYGHLWTKYHPWSLAIFALLCTILGPIYLAWLFSWDPERALHRGLIRAVGMSSWAEEFLPLLVERAWRLEDFIRGKVRGKWAPRRPRFLLEILSELRSELLWRVLRRDRPDDLAAATRLTNLEVRLRRLPNALPEDRWRVLALWLELDLVEAGSATAQAQERARLRAEPREEHPLAWRLAGLRGWATRDEEPRPATVFEHSEVTAAVLLCLEHPGSLKTAEGARLLTWLAEFEAALSRPEFPLPALKPDELRALGLVLCFFAAAVALRAERTSPRAAANLLGRHLNLLEGLRWRVLFEEPGPSESAWRHLVRDVPPALVCQTAHRLNGTNDPHAALREGSLWVPGDFAFDLHDRHAIAEAAGPDFLPARGDARVAWEGDRGLAHFHWRQLPQTMGRWSRRQRMDVVLVGGVAAFILAALLCWLGVVGTLDRLDKFDLVYSADGKRPVPDERILENVRRELADKPILDATLHREQAGADPRLVLSQGGVVQSYDPATRLWETVRPSFPELLKPEIDRLQTTFAPKGRGAQPLWGHTAGAGLVEYFHGKWQTVVSDTQFTHPGGVPVEAGELVMAACSGPDESPEWILYAAAAAGKSVTLGLYRPATRHWDNFPSPAAPLPFEQLTKLVWWKDAFQLGTEKGVFTMLPQAGASFAPVEVLGGRKVLDLDVSRDGELWVLDENAGAGGALRLSSLTGLGKAESLWDEVSVNPEVSLSSLRYAFQKGDGSLYLGGNPGLLTYDSGRHSWKAQFDKPLTAFLPTADRKGFVFGFKGGAAVVRADQSLKALYFGGSGSDVTRLKLSPSGKTYALTRDAGELFEVSEDGAPALYRPGGTSLFPASFHTALAREDELLFVGLKGAVRHSVTDRTYADIAEGKVPAWFRQPRLPLTESGGLVFGADDQMVHSVPQAEAFAGNFDSAKAIALNSVEKLHPGRAGAALAKLTDGRCYEVTDTAKRSVLGPPTAGVLGAFIDAAEAGPRVFFSTPTQLFPYQTGTRAWMPPILLPGEKPAELAAHGADLFIATEKQRLLSLDSTNAITTVLGGDADVPLTDAGLSDARLAGGQLFLAGEDFDGKAAVTAYSLSERRVSHVWSTPVAASPVLADIIDGKPVFQAGQGAYLGDRQLGGLGVRRVFTGDERIWVHRRQGDESYLTGYERSTGELLSSLFRFPAAGSLARDVREGFVLQDDVLALADESALRFYVPAQRSWYRLANDLPHAETALLSGAAPAERFVFLGSPQAASGASIYFCPEQSFQFPLETDEAICQSSRRNVRAYSVDQENQTVTFITKDGAVGQWAKGVFTEAVIPAPGAAPEMTSLRHFYDASSGEEIVLLVVDQEGGLWRYQRARNPALWQGRTSMWTQLSLTPPLRGASHLELHATPGDWWAARTEPGPAGSTVHQARFDPRNDVSINFGGAALAEPMGRPYKAAAGDLQDVLSLGERTEDPWVFLSQQQVDWFDPDRRAWGRSALLPGATGPLRFVEWEGKFPLVVGQQGTHFWVPSERARVPAEFRLRTRDPLQKEQAFLYAGPDRNFGTVYTFSPAKPLQSQSLTAAAAAPVERFFAMDPDKLQHAWAWPDADHLLFDSESQGLHLYHRKKYGEEALPLGEDGQPLTFQNAQMTVQVEGALWTYFKQKHELMRLEARPGPGGELSLKVRRWTKIDDFALSGLEPRILREKRWESWDAGSFVPEQVDAKDLARWPVNGRLHPPARSAISGHLQRAASGFASDLVIDGPPAKMQALVQTKAGVWLIADGRVRLYSEPGRPILSSQPAALPSLSPESLWIHEDTQFPAQAINISTAEKKGVRVTVAGAALTVVPVELDDLSPVTVLPNVNKPLLAGSRPAASPGGEAQARFVGAALKITESKQDLGFTGPDGATIAMSGTPPAVPLVRVYQVNPPASSNRPPQRYYLRNREGFVQVDLTRGGTAAEIGPLVRCEDVRWDVSGRPAWLKIGGRWEPAPDGTAAQAAVLATLPPVPTAAAPNPLPVPANLWSKGSELWPAEDKYRYFPLRGGRRVFDPIQQLVIDRATGNLVARLADDRDGHPRERYAMAGPFLQLDDQLPSPPSLSIDWLKWKRKSADSPAGLEVNGTFQPTDNWLRDEHFFFERTEALLPLFQDANDLEPSTLAAANRRGILRFPARGSFTPLSLRRREIVFQPMPAFGSLVGDVSAGHDHFLALGMAWRFDGRRFVENASAAVSYNFGDLRIAQDLRAGKVDITFGARKGYRVSGGFEWDYRLGLAKAGAQLWFTTPLGLQSSASEESGYLATPGEPGQLRSLFRRTDTRPLPLSVIYWAGTAGSWLPLAPAGEPRPDPRLHRRVVDGSWRVETDAQGVPAISWKGQPLAATFTGGLSFLSDQLLQATGEGSTLFAVTNAGVEVAPGGLGELRRRPAPPRPLSGFQEIITLPVVGGSPVQGQPITFLTTGNGGARSTEKWDAGSASWKGDPKGAQRDGAFRLVDSGGQPATGNGRIVITAQRARGAPPVPLQKQIFLRLPGPDAAAKPVDFALEGRFPWDRVRSLAQQGNRLFVGTNAGLEIHPLPLAGSGLGGGVTLLHLGQPGRGAVDRVGLVEQAGKPPVLLAKQGERLYEIDPGGAFSLSALPSLATRLRLLREGFWVWTKGDSRVNGFYLRQGAPDRAPVTQNAAGYFAHDQVRDFACVGGESFALWNNGWITMSQAPDLGLGTAARPRNFTFPSGTSAPSASPVALLDLSHGPAVRGREIPTGLWARVEEKSLWRWENGNWVQATPERQAAAEEEARRRTLYQHGHWRLVDLAAAPAPGDPPPFQRLALEQRTGNGSQGREDWQPIGWVAKGSPALSRYVIDDWLDYEPLPRTSEGLAATPAGLLLLQDKGGAIRLNPERAVVLRGDFLKPEPVELEVRLDAQGTLQLRVDRQSARVWQGSVDLADPGKVDVQSLVPLDQDPFKTRPYLRLEETKLWEWTLVDDFDGPEGKSRARLEGRLSLREKGASPIRLNGGHFGFDRLKSIAFYTGDALELAGDDGWIRALKSHRLKLTDLLRPDFPGVDTHAVDGVFLAALPGETKPHSLALQRTKTTAPGEKAVGDYLFDGKTVTPTGNASEFLGHDGFWQHLRRADGRLEMRPKDARNAVARPLAGGRFGDDDLLGFPVLASWPETATTALVPTAAGIVGWNSENRPTVIAAEAPTARALVSGPDGRLLIVHADGAITSMEGARVAELKHWSSGCAIIGVEPHVDGTYHVRFEAEGRRQFRNFTLSAAPAVTSDNIMAYPLRGVVSWERLRSRFDLPSTLMFEVGPGVLLVSDHRGLLQETSFASRDNFRRIALFGEYGIYTAADEVWMIDVKGCIRRSALPFAP